MYKMLIKQIIEMFYNIFMALSSLFWHRDEKTVLFGAWFGLKFADNSRFLFQYLSENKYKLGLNHVVWVTRDKDIVERLNKMGYEAYLMNSKKSIYYHKKAKYHFICEACNDIYRQNGDILGQYSFGAVRINLWHGVGAIKNVKYSTIDLNSKKSILTKLKVWLHDNSKFYRLILEENGGWADCFYLSTSEAETEQLKAFFRISVDKCIRSDYPRNFPPEKFEEKEMRVIKLIEEKKSVLYLPTFRETSKSFDFRKVAPALRDIIKKENVIWIQKAHSAAQEKNDEIDYDGVIMNLPHDFDINILYKYVNLVVTDYSTAAVDALYHCLPTIFYVPDMDDYEKTERGFYEPIRDRMFGPTAQNVDELGKLVIDLCNTPAAAYTEKYYFEKKRWWDKKCSCMEIWQDIVNFTRN